MSDVWESEGVVVERWESNSTPGLVLNVVIRDGDIIASVSDEQIADAVVAFFAGSTPVLEGDGAGGALAGSYPDPALNTDALAAWLNGLIVAGENIETVFDAGAGEADPSLTISAVSTVYYESTGAQPWSQDGADFTDSSASVRGFVTRTSSYVAHATLTFNAIANVVTPGEGQPRFWVRELFRSLDEEFAGWFWGWSSPSVRVPVHGIIGGLPFVGWVNRSGRILDADGNTVSRVIQTEDQLIGTVTGVFQND